MGNNSRLYKSFLNARVNLVFYFITLLLSFFSRKIFLDSLGDDFVGLTGTLQNLLGFLNLAEMGIGAAIGYVLYRPLFDDNKEKINEIISVLGYMYRCVGLCILSAGVIVSLFLPRIFASVKFEPLLIYFVYYSFLASSLISYFINYRQTLLGADQRNYVVTAYYQSANVCKIIIQIFLALWTGNYYLWAGIELTFGVIYSIILNLKINQVYPWLKSDIRSGKSLLIKYPDVILYTKQLFVHKIGSIVYGQITPFLVYAFASLQTVAFYGNYTMIVSKLDALINNILTSTSAGVGNLIAEGNQEKTLRIYWELMSIRFWVAGVFVFVLYHILPSFIDLWLGKEYILSNKTLILVLISFFLGIVRGTNDQFVLGFGLFADIWAPFVEAFLLIGVAIVGGNIWGFEGTLLGAIVSTILIVYVWKPYYLFKKGFKLHICKYWFPWLKHLFLTFLITLLSGYVISRIAYLGDLNQSWMRFILSSVIITLIYSLLSIVIFYTCIKSMRDVIKRLLFFIKNRVCSKVG